MKGQWPWPVERLRGQAIELFSRAVNSDHFEEPVAADGLLQKPERRLCVSVLRQQKVNGLAVLIHGAIEIGPWPFTLMYVSSIRQLLHTGRLRR